MNILHVIPSIDARYGGPSYAVLAMVRFQNEAGLRTDIATTHKKQVESRKSKVERKSDGTIFNNSNQVIKDGQSPDGARIFSFPSCLGEYKFSWGLWLWLKSNIRNYDVVHIHSVFCFSTAAAATAAKSAGIPYIVRPLGQLYPWALKNRSWMLKKAYLVVVENKTMQDAAAIHFTVQDELAQCGIEIDKAKTYVLPLGIEQPQDMSKSMALMICPELKDKKVLLFLSRIHPKKGLDLVLPWLAPLILKRSEWVVVIAGEAESVEYLTSLRQLIRQYSIENQVVFTGKVSGDNKTALYALADLFFLPSHSENFGIAVVEAMAAGVPVLVSDQVGVYKEVSSHQAGLAFRLEEGSLSGAVARLMEDDVLRKAMGENAKRLTNEKFDWRSITAQQINHYQQILDQNIRG